MMHMRSRHVVIRGPLCRDNSVLPLLRGPQHHVYVISFTSTTSLALAPSVQINFFAFENNYRILRPNKISEYTNYKASIKMFLITLVIKNKKL